MHNLVAKAIRPEIYPSIIGIRGKNSSPIFHYEFGTVVEIKMFNLVNLEPASTRGRFPRQDWVITGAKVRYREGGSEVKKEETWGVERLSQLREDLPLRDPAEIKGRVVIFYDNASDEGCVRVDPERNQEGYMSLREEFPYRVLVSGDRKKVVAETEDRLAKY